MNSKHDSSDELDMVEFTKIGRKERAKKLIEDSKMRESRRKLV